MEIVQYNVSTIVIYATAPHRGKWKMPYQYGERVNILVASARSDLDKTQALLRTAGYPDVVFLPHRDDSIEAKSSCVEQEGTHKLCYRVKDNAKPHWIASKTELKDVRESRRVEISEWQTFEGTLDIGMREGSFNAGQNVCIIATSSDAGQTVNIVSLNDSLQKIFGDAPYVWLHYSDDGGSKYNSNTETCVDISVAEDELDFFGRYSRKLFDKNLKQATPGDIKSAVNDAEKQMNEAKEKLSFKNILPRVQAILEKKQFNFATKQHADDVLTGVRKASGDRKINRNGSGSSFKYKTTVKYETTSSDGSSDDGGPGSPGGEGSKRESVPPNSKFDGSRGKADAPVEVEDVGFSSGEDDPQKKKKKPKSDDEDREILAINDNPARLAKTAGDAAAAEAGAEAAAAAEAEAEAKRSHLQRRLRRMVRKAKSDDGDEDDDAAAADPQKKKKKKKKKKKPKSSKPVKSDDEDREILAINDNPARLAKTAGDAAAAEAEAEAERSASAEETDDGSDEVDDGEYYVVDEDDDEEEDDEEIEIVVHRPVSFHWTPPIQRVNVYQPPQKEEAEGSPAANHRGADDIIGRMVRKAIVEAAAEAAAEEAGAAAAAEAEAERSAVDEKTDDENDEVDDGDEYPNPSRISPAYDKLEAELNEGLAALEAEKIACEAKLKQARAQIADDAQATAGLKAAYDKATAEGADEEQRRDKLYVKQASLEAQLEQCIAASAAAKAKSAVELSSYVAMLEQEKSKRADASNALQALRGTKAALEKKLDKSQADLDEAHASVEEYRKKADSAGIDESKGESQIKALRAKVRELESQAGTGGNLKLADVKTRIDLLAERHASLAKTHNGEIMRALEALQTTHTESKAELANLKGVVKTVKDGDNDDIANIARAITEIKATVQSHHTAVNEITRDATQNKADHEAELGQIKAKLEEITQQFAQARTNAANAALTSTVRAAMKVEMEALLERVPEGLQSFAGHLIEANEEQNPFKSERKFQWLTL